MKLESLNWNASRPHCSVLNCLHSKCSMSSNQPGLQVFDGPNSLEHFSNFSVDAVIAELQTNAPDVYRLFMTLGATSRNVQSKDDGIIPEEIRAHTAIFTLLKARSVRVKGIQLLLSFMLIARATSRQVSYPSTSIVTSHKY